MKVYNTPMISVYGDAATLTQATDHKTFVTDVVKGTPVTTDPSGFPNAFVS